METMVSRTLSVHKEHEFLLKLEVAGLNDDLAQKVIDSRGNKLARRVVGLIGGEKPKETQSTPPYHILRPVAPTVQPATYSFRADETFFAKNAKVKIVYRGGDFAKWFRGKEESVFVRELEPFMLVKSASDHEIIADLGGDEKAEVALSEIWRLMERQPNGEKGKLLVNQWANVFYCKDVSMALRAVFVYWNGDGWCVDASSVDGRGWNVGYQVFSRNS